MSEHVHDIIRLCKDIGAGIRHVRVPGSLGELHSLPQSVHKQLRKALYSSGIRGFYSHQAEAWRQYEKGKSYCVTTGTASGKSLCYTVPILQDFLLDGSSTALLLFPTKALAHDQLSQLQSLFKHITPLPPVGVYDGDTPWEERRSKRKTAHFILSNPDMLHASILPNHPQWARFFANLKTIVIDEAHVYRGVFGSHVCNVLRRLLRIVHHYGGQPRFVLCSATLSNPEHFLRRFVPLPVTVIHNDRTPRPPRDYLFVTPGVIDRRSGLRENYLRTTERLEEMLRSKNLTSLCFVKSRQAVEILLKCIRSTIKAKCTSSEEAILGYRGGYLPHTRREIEGRFREGSIRSLITTNAMEVGVDIGQLDAVIVAGFPGSIQSFRQQAGRSGRRGDGALVLFVARSHPIDQYIAHSPDYVLQGNTEVLALDGNNLSILLAHLNCATAELPWHPGENYGDLPFGDLTPVLEHLAADGCVLQRQGRFFSNPTSNATPFSLRTIPGDTIAVRDATTGKVFAEIPAYRAPQTLHEGAVYLHEGATYHVVERCEKTKTAVARRASLDYFTVPLTRRMVRIEQSLSSVDELDFRFELGAVGVTSTIHGYKNIRIQTKEHLGTHALPETTQRFKTVGLGILPKRTPHEHENLSGAALEDLNESLLHVLLHVSALHLQCDVSDLGGCSLPSSEKGRSHPPQNGILLFEVHPGGLGFAETLFEDRRALFRHGAAFIEACECASGCILCLGGGTSNTEIQKQHVLASLTMWNDHQGPYGPHPTHLSHTPALPKEHP